MTRSPSISIVIATKDRPEHIGRAVESILQCSYPVFKLYVIDQSRDDRTRDAIARHLNDDRLIYHRIVPSGYSTAHNFGIGLADSEFIALTDDDCTVPSDWLERIVALFRTNPRIGVIFGNVLAAPHRPDAGWIPTYVLDEPVLLDRSTTTRVIRGFGACMALRRECWEAVGGFDTMAGPGAPFRSGGDQDLAFRIMLNGHLVLETPYVSITHWGLRDRLAGRHLMYRYWFGRGARLAKLLRLHQWSYLILAWRQMEIERQLLNLLLLRRPLHVLWLVALLHGFLAAVTRPVDPKTLKWRPRGRCLT